MYNSDNDNIAYLTISDDLYTILSNSSKLIANNVKSIDSDVFLTKDDVLCTIESNTPIVLMENVKNYLWTNSFYSNTLMILTKDDKLYALGDNVFGKRYNFGNDFYSPELILENVKKIGKTYAIDNDNNLYYYYNNNKQVMEQNVIDALESSITNYDYEGILVYQNSSNETKIYYKESNKIYDSPVTFNEIADITYKSILLKNGDYYIYKLNTFYDNKNIELNNKIGNNVVQAIYNYYLTENGDLFISDSAYYHNYDDDTKYELFLKNVKKIIDENTFIMKDNTLWIKGDNRGNRLGEEVYPEDFSTEIPVEAIKLPNVLDTIKVKQIVIRTHLETELTVGNTYYYTAFAMPLNAINKEVVWSSSNEDIITVTNEGNVTAISPGEANITVTTTDGLISDTVTVRVYPKPSEIQILNGDSLDAELQKYILLEAKVLPEDTLLKEVTWKVLNSESNNNIYLDNYCYSYYIEEYGIDCQPGKNLPSNKTLIEIHAGGSYEIAAYTEDGNHVDTIIINTVEKVYDIELDIGKDNYDGINNVFIYLSESPELKVNYNVYPTTATNQNVTWESHDPDIATVDSTGKITAYKTGRARITIKSEDQGAERTFNVLVYDYSSSNAIIGDVNGDGAVDILDLTKLRRYLAGLEESLQ